MIRCAVIGLIGMALLSIGALGQTCTVQVFFTSPDTGDGAMTALLQSVDATRSTLEIAVAVFADERLGDAVVRAHRRGVIVRVILARGNDGIIGSQYQKLTAAGIPVRLSGGSGTFSHRFAIADRRIALTGSYEWVDRARGGRFDNLVRITCSTSSQAYLAEFERLWANWSSDAAAPGVTVTAISSVSILSVDRAAQCVYLLNASDAPVDVSGWSLNDLEGAYTFPAGTEIPPDDAYRICSDEFNPTHDVTGFFLETPHDELFLVTPEGDIIDERVW